VTEGQGDDVSASRIVLRPLASPLPLGFLALAAGTLTLSGIQLSWVPAAQLTAAGLVVLAFTVPLQALSSGYGFQARDAAAATGMAIQAGGWFAIGLASYAVPTATVPALGLLLLGAASALLVPMVTAALTKLLASVVMGLTALRFYLTAAYELSASPAWKEAAGITGLVLFAVALYAGLAFELEDSRGTTVLPTFRRGPGRTALAGDFAQEVTGVQREAGVRRKL
jgi:succinate-acetate transporter protein